jgi:hypothetical protein
MRSDRQVRALLGRGSWPPASVLAKVVNAVDVLKPSFRGEQFDGRLHTDDVRLVIYRTSDRGPPAAGGSRKDRDSVGGDNRCSIFGNGRQQSAYVGLVVQAFDCLEKAMGVGEVRGGERHCRCGRRQAALSCRRGILRRSN